MRGGSISAAAFAFVVAAVAWHFAAPWWTLREIRHAAEAHDAAALAEHVDFTSLRESLKAELAAAMTAGAAAGADGPAAFGAAPGAAMIDPLVDGLVSPAGLRMMFAAGRPGAAPVAGFGTDDEVAIARDGFSTFRVARRDAPQDGALVFRRHGYAWKLAGVELPGGGLALAAR